MRRLPALLLLLAFAAPVGAGEDGEKEWIHLEGATVLASPGVPEAVRVLLPGKRAPKPLTWPLPHGPLLVLGLPDTDETAADLASLWHLMPPDGDLHGGYVAHAWHDGTRPVAAIFAADGVALRVACMHGRTPMRVRAGWRHERPRYRVRASFLVVGATPEEALARSVDLHANRLWIELWGRSDEEISALLPKLAHHGIQPVLYTANQDEAMPRLAKAARRHGITRVAFTPAAETPAGQRRAMRALREGVPALDELIVIPPPKCTDLTGLDGASLGWMGDGPCRDPVTLEQARAVRRRHAGPVHFVEGWAALGEVPWDDPREPPWIPTRPRGRDPRLGDALDGIVVVGGRGTEPALRAAWYGPPADRRDAWEAVLLPLLPRKPLAPDAFCKRSAKRLAAAAGTEGAPFWMKPLATWLARQEHTLPPTAIGVPRVPAAIQADGLLDEPAWGYAGRRAVRFRLTSGDREVRWRKLELLVFANGRDLCVAARAPAALTHLALGLDGDECGTVSTRRHGDERVWEWEFPARVLDVDAYPTRRYEIYLRSRRQIVVERETLLLMP